uniref:N-terminal asparagine amidohydrolase n=1 Tax=Cyprinus carpio TaxID=7962 RepID=A0A8C2G7F9_CYPCA
KFLFFNASRLPNSHIKKWILNESAKQFVSRSPEAVDTKQLLYVQQREFAATTPADNSVSVLGSDDATTCHLVVLRHTGSGATCLAHCDGSSTCTEVPLIVSAVTSRSAPAKEGRLELHLVGGFDDDRRTSHSLSLSILAAFQKQTEEIHLETCCITDMNDVIKDGIHRPVVYGIGAVQHLHLFLISPSQCDGHCSTDVMCLLSECKTLNLKK